MLIWKSIKKIKPQNMNFSNAMEYFTRKDDPFKREDFSVLVNKDNIHDQVLRIKRPDFIREQSHQSFLIVNDMVEFKIPKDTLIHSIAGLSSYLFTKRQK